jgi:hypothetical protein
MTTNPTTEQMNREVADWPEIEWDNTDISYKDCGIDFCPGKKPLPDFSRGTGIIRLLEEVMKRED